MRLVVLIVVLLPLAARASEIVLDNEYVRVTRDGLSCARGDEPRCGDRVIVALDGLELEIDGRTSRLARGETAVLERGRPSATPSGAYLEIAINPRHPPALAPAVRIQPGKNELLHDAQDYFVFEEKLAPGDTRERHSHSQRVVIQLNATRLQQWPDGEPGKIVDTIPDKVSFSPPVVHVVRNVGTAPLRGIIIEFKPD